MERQIQKKSGFCLDGSERRLQNWKLSGKSFDLYKRVPFVRLYIGFPLRSHKLWTECFLHFLSVCGKM